MKKLLMLILLTLAGVLTWYFFVTRKKPKDEGIKKEPVALGASRYSDTFNVSVNSMLTAYYTLSGDLVAWDSAAVDRHAGELEDRLEEVKLGELAKDTAIYETARSYVDAAKGETATLQKAPDLTAKRRSFHNLTQSLYDLLRTVRYDRAKVYLQECPMAFNDEEQGLWLDRTDSIRNPYLGLHHPKYGRGMLECGGTKDSLDFTQAASSPVNSAPNGDRQEKPSRGKP